MNNSNPNAWMEFAIWLRAEALRRNVPLNAIQPYAGFWSKVSSGRVRAIPEETVVILEKIFRKSIGELADEAGVALFSQSVGGDRYQDKGVENVLPLRNSEHEVALVWSDGVPDHMWPYIAFKRGYFSDARIKATLLDAECASDFPAGYGEAMHSRLPKSACGTGTWDEMKELKGWPIAVTHHFIGFAAIGRAPSRVRPVERDSSRDFGRLVYELSRRNIAPGRIGCVTENSIEFLKMALQLGHDCSPETSIREISLEQVVVAVERTPNLLEELYELGEWGWDLVVGHALTHAIALQNPSRYRVYFTWERLRAIAEKVKSPVTAKLDRLAVPVPFLLNRPPEEADRALVCRLWSIAFRASTSIIGSMPPSTSAELLGDLKSLIPYSNPGDTAVTPSVFSSAWQKSYRPLMQAQMLSTLDDMRSPIDRHDSLKLALKWVNEEKDEAEHLIKKLSRRSGSVAKQACITAQQFMALGNFYDARLEAQV